MLHTIAQQVPHLRTNKRDVMTTRVEVTCTKHFWEQIRFLWLTVRWYAETAFCRECDAEFDQFEAFKCRGRSPTAYICVDKHSGDFVAPARSLSISLEELKIGSRRTPRKREKESRRTSAIRKCSSYLVESSVLERFRTTGRKSVQPCEFAEASTMVDI